MANTRVTNPVTDFDKSNTTQGLKLPSGTNSNQPTGVQGMLRNDTDETGGDSSDSALTHYNGTNWRYFAATESPDVVYPTSLKIYTDANNSSSYSGTGTTWSDLTSNGNNGTISGATFVNSSSPYYFDFDGTSTGDTVSFGNLNITPKVSYVAWVQRSSSQTNAYGRLFWKNTSAVGLQVNSSGVWYPYLNGSGLSTFTYASTNTWMHVALAYDQQNFKIYIDGSQKLSYASTAAVGVTVTPLTLSEASNQRGWQGKIANFKAYDVGLTAAEVLLDFNNTKAAFGL